jgi:tetratricopeptide (TPR) repeat protein
MIRNLLKTAGTLLLLASAAFAATTTIPSARDLVYAGRVNEALQALNSRVQTNRQDAEAFHLLCRAYYMVQRWDDAISNGERALALNPNDSNYHLWLGRAYGEKAESSNFLVAIELAKKVREHFERAVQLDGNNLSARTDLAEFYVDAPGFLGGGKDKARTQANVIMQSDAPSAHWVLAAIADKDKKYDVAEQEYKASLQASGMQAREWLNMASFYRRRKRFDEMEQAINQAAANPKGYQQGLFEGAQLLYASGRNFGLATQLLRRYIANGNPDPEAPLFQAHYLLGTILEKQGDRQGAVQEYRASLALARDFGKAQTALERVQVAANR